MYYKEEDISNELKCPKCCQKYGDPRILPCGDTLCQECINSDLIITSSLSPPQIKCQICQQTHEAPVDLVFPRNNFIFNLLTKKPLTLRDNDLSTKLKLTMSQLSERRADLERNYELRSKILNDFCSELRFQVDIAAETRIEAINEQRDQILHEIKRYELDCQRNMSENVKDGQLKSLLTSVDEFGEEVSGYFKDSTTVANLSEKCVSESLKIAQIYLRVLGASMDGLESYIFMERKPRFASNEDEIGKDFIGKLHFEVEKRNNDVVSKFKVVKKMGSLDLRQIIDAKAIKSNVSCKWLQAEKKFILFNYQNTGRNVMMFDRKGLVVKTKEMGFNSSNACLIKTAVSNDLVAVLLKKKPKSNFFRLRYSSQESDPILQINRLSTPNLCWLPLAESHGHIDGYYSIAINSSRLYCLASNYLCIFAHDFQGPLRAVSIANQPNLPFYLPSISSQSEIQVDEDFLYYSNDRHSLYVMDINDGRQMWRLELGEEKSFVVGEKTVVVLDSDEMVIYELDRFSGEELMARKVVLEDSGEFKETKPRKLKLMQCDNGKALILDENNLRIFFDY